MQKRLFNLQLFANTQTADLTSQYKSYIREEQAFRPVANSVYTPGSAVQLVAIDKQSYPDYKTVDLCATGANQQGLVGVVSGSWGGFGPPGDTPANYTAPANVSVGGSAGLRGTLGIDTVVCGPVAGILLDCSGTGGVTVVDKLALIASRATAGYVQGGSASAPAGGTAVVANAMLPSTGIGSSITAAALAQASQTATVAGTPAVGDTLSVTIQSPYIDSAPGTAQTITYTTPPLTTAQAVSVTTAAAALVAYLNAQASFALYFTATNAAGVVTVTVNAAAALFYVNYAGNGVLIGGFNISISGMVANSLTFACAATGGSTNTAGAANFASGTGFKGYIPAVVRKNGF